MTDKAVSALTSLTGATTATGDLLYIVDISEAAAADRSKKITAQELQNYVKAFPATIGVGGATPAASGAGISFPATASASSDANTLDDYEEGTWTPAIRGAATAGTYELSTATGFYTKVGNKVTIWCRIVFDSVITGGGSAYLQITGIPFTNSAACNAAVKVSGLDFSAGYTYLVAAPTASSGVTTWYLEECGDNVSQSDFPISGVSANDQIVFSSTFRN